MPKQPSEYLSISFRAGDLEPSLRTRVGTGFAGSVHQVAQRDLDRYYRLLMRSLRSIRLSLNEASLIMDALNGTLMTTESIPYLWHEIEDAMVEGLAEKWQVDGPALVDKLRDLDDAQVATVIDAIERAWAMTEGTPEDRLRAVGLVRS